MTTYSTNLALTLIGSGEQDGTWGTTTNTNLGTLLEQAISGYTTYACTGGTDTITIPNGATGVARNMYLELTGTGGGTLIVPNNRKLYYIYNNTGSGSVTVKVSGQTGVTVTNGRKMSLVCDGTDVVEAITLATTAEAAYPVGSIYMNASVATNPATLLGFGTWTAFGAGRVLLGDGGGFSAGETGGSADAVVVAHTHTVTDPGHIHTIHYQSTDGGANYGSTTAGCATGTQTNSATTGISIGSSGVSGTGANLQPYIVVYMWQRTA